MLAAPGAGNLSETQKKQLTEKKPEKTESGKKIPAVGESRPRILPSSFNQIAQSFLLLSNGFDRDGA